LYSVYLWFLLEENFHIKTKNANYYFDNGIFICEVNSDIILDLEMAKKLVLERKRMIHTSDLPILIVIRNYLLLDKQAFNYFSSKDGSEGIIATAVVIKSSFQRIIANFNLLFSQQYKFFKVFNRTSDAKLWLFKYILQNEDDFNRNLLSVSSLPHTLKFKNLLLHRICIG